MAGYSNCGRSGHKVDLEGKRMDIALVNDNCHSAQSTVYYSFAGLSGGTALLLLVSLGFLPWVSRHIPLGYNFFDKCEN